MTREEINRATRQLMAEAVEIAKKNVDKRTTRS